HPLVREPQHHGMLRFEGDRVFHANPNQFADGKESSVVDFFVGGAPKRKFVGLLGQQPIHEQKRRGYTALAVEQPDVPIHESRYFGCASIESPETLFNRLPVLPPLSRGLDWRGCGARDLCYRGENSLEFL